MSFILCEVFTLLGLLYLVKREIGHFPKSLKDMIILGEDQFPEDDTLAVSIDSEEKLFYLIENLNELMVNNTLNEKTILRIRLMIEETD